MRVSDVDERIVKGVVERIFKRIGSTNNRRQLLTILHHPSALTVDLVSKSKDV